MRGLYTRQRFERDGRQFRSDEGQAGRRSGRGQQPLHRLWYRQGLPRGGAELALTWQGDALKKRVEPLAAELGAITLGHCDVTDPATIDAVFAELEKQ